MSTAVERIKANVCLLPRTADIWRAFRRVLWLQKSHFAASHPKVEKKVNPPTLMIIVASFSAYICSRPVVKIYF